MEKTQFKKEEAKLRKMNDNEIINWKLDNFSYLTTKQKKRVKKLEER